MNKREFLNLLASAAVAAPVAALVTGGKEQDISKDVKENVYDRMMRTKIIRCGYVDWPPEFTRDPVTGKFSGIVYDIMMEMAKRMGVQIEWTEQVNFGTMMEGLKSGRYDLVAFSTYRESSRAMVADFTTPLFFSGTGVYVRADDARFDSIASADVFNNTSVTISTMDGELSSIIADQQFAKAKKVALPQNSDFSQLLLNVSNKKADVTFANQMAAQKFIDSNPAKIKKLDIEPVRMFSHGFVYDKGEYDFGKSMDLVIEEMHAQGFIDRVLARYTLYRQAFIPVSKAYMAD
jgi:polar amino acid transport system substrate-binding protein